MTTEERAIWLQSLEAGDRVILEVQQSDGTSWFEDAIEITNSEFVGVHCYLIQRGLGYLSIPSFKVKLMIHPQHDKIAQEGLERFKLRMMLKRWNDEDFASHVSIDIVQNVLRAGGLK